MRKLFLLFILSVFFIACGDSSSDKKINSNTATTNTSTDETKKKELELKEKELDIKEKQLQKDKELTDKEKELAEKEKQLQEKNQRLEQNNNNPQSNNKIRRDYTGNFGSYPEGSKRYLDYNDIYGKTKWQLKVMRNEIFARHGYIFQSADLRNYFSKQPWYYPAYDDVTGMLSAIEKYNVNFIKGYE